MLGVMCYGNVCRNVCTNGLVARSCEKTPAGIWTIDFVQGIIWFGDNPCRKYTENQGICDKKLTKNTKNNEVYAEPILEIQGKLKFFDRSLKPGQTKNAPRRRDLCSGFKFIYDKKFRVLGAFLRPGGSKNAKNQQTSKAEPS